MIAFIAGDVEYDNGGADRRGGGSGAGVNSNVVTIELGGVMGRVGGGGAVSCSQTFWRCRLCLIAKRSITTKMTAAAVLLP